MRLRTIVCKRQSTLSGALAQEKAMTMHFRKIKQDLDASIGKSGSSQESLNQDVKEL